MPKAWSEKDERKYEHIKESVVKKSGDKKKAKSIAAATVNKDRRKQGRTLNKTTQGTGNPNKPFAQRTKQELYNIAQKKNITGRSKMSKEELIKALRK